MIVYPPRVYGPGLMTESNAVTKLIQQYMKGKWRLIPGDGQKTGCYAFIDDVSEGHIKALKQGKPGSRYILGGENADYFRLFDVIRKYSVKDYKLFKVPLPLMLAFGRYQLLKNKISGNPPLLTPKWIRKYLYEWSLNSDKAVEEIDYQITPLEEGIRRTVDWLKEKNRI